MSRAPVSKNAKDKKGGQATSTPIVTHDIIPGKVTDNDWAQMIEKDEGEDFVIDIRDEIVDAAMIHIYYLYLDHQLLPYTISQAKDALLQIVEWRFLSHDVGEVDTENDVSWQPDEEPMPAITDCWAQGSVPKQILRAERTPTPIAEEPQIAEIANIDESSQLADMGAVVEVDEVKGDELEASTVSFLSVPSNITPCTVPITKPKKLKRHYGPLRSAGVSHMTETLDKTEERLANLEYELTRANVIRNVVPQLVNMPTSCQSLIRVQQNRPALDRDIKYDEYGNVIAMVKLNPDKLPSHCIKVQYRVRDPRADAKDKLILAMASGQYVAKSISSKKDESIQHIDRSSCASRRTQVITPTGLNGRGCQSNITNLPSSLIENIDLSPGVTVKEGNMVRRGPPRKQRGKCRITDESDKLRTVGSLKSWVKINASDILDQNPPMVTQISEPAVLPPINKQSIHATEM